MHQVPGLENPIVNQWQIQGGHSRHAPPIDQNPLNFMQFFRKIWQICMLALPPGGLAPLPREILDPPLLTDVLLASM